MKTNWMQTNWMPANWMPTWVLFLSLSVLPAQAGESPGGPRAKAPQAGAGQTVSDAGRAALAACRELAGKVKGLRGADRLQVLERAASAYDKVVADFAQEPAVAAAAAIAAADIWRQHGSLPLAEKDYLLAAQLDVGRFAQRGLCGAADMQRRQKRLEEAMATYVKAAAVDPASGRAQDARLWQARILQSMERLDEAIPAFQAALEAARPGSDTIEAANFLALAWVQKGDLDAAQHVIEHAEEAVAGLGEEDPVVVERLRKAIEAMSARRALQRARDQRDGAAEDAAQLERDRSRVGGGH